MAFSDVEKADIRRFCGFQAFGGQPVQAFGHRFYTHYGALEFRMGNLSAAEEAIVRSRLAELTELEAAVVGASANLDTAQAAVWTHNKNEVRDRLVLFDEWRRRLCQFFGIQPGPGLASGGGITIVV